VPSQTFSHRALTTATPEEVWEQLDQPRTWEAIGGVDRVFDPEVDGEGRLRGFSFDTVAAGRKYVGEARPHQRVEGEVMAWDIENPEIRGVITVAVRPAESGTEIRVTMEVHSVGFLSSMLFPVIATAIGSGLSKTVDEFAHELGA
jgi:carbon monoxide dehydrogenase subunit G